MRSILFFATFLHIGAVVMAKSNPVLRHHQNKNNVLRFLGTEAECAEYFTALDADSSGDITMEDINVISTRPDAAHLMDVFFSTLFATGVTSIQDAFSINEETFVLYCSEAYYRDMSLAVAERVEFLKQAKLNKQKNLQIPSCYAECPDGQYCGSGGGCQPTGTCGTLDDCYNSENIYPASTCLGELECNVGQCTMNCAKVQQKHKNTLSHYKQHSQLSTTCEDFLDYWYSTYFFEPYCEECLEGGCVFANDRCANECMADASCFTDYCPMPDDCHSCLDRGYVWTAGECSEQCMADASCYTSIVDCP